MAVMRTCCGCLTTRSGTLTILLLFLIAYIGGIVIFSMMINNPANYVNPGALDCLNSTSKDSWWCQAGSNFQVVVASAFFLTIIVAFAIADLLAIYGTIKSSEWFLMPWIVVEFIRLLIKFLLLVLTIVLWVIFMDQNADTSFIIAIGVIGLLFLTFFFYLWLCVVSHFQVLRAYRKMEEELDSNKSVVPFVPDDDNEYRPDREDIIDEDLDDRKIPSRHIE